MPSRRSTTPATASRRCCGGTCRRTRRRSGWRATPTTRRSRPTRSRPAGSSPASTTATTRPATRCATSTARCSPGPRARPRARCWIWPGDILDRMPPHWPSLPYDVWRATCDTLHAHTQVLGKLAATLAPPEPQLQHAALRLTARGWETYPIPAPDGSGAFVVALDLHRHAAIAEHSDGRTRTVALTPHRAVGDVTRGLPRA